jgi:predicted Holliday junction resolvase-like endonuclease
MSFGSGIPSLESGEDECERLDPVCVLLYSPTDCSFVGTPLSLLSRKRLSRESSLEREYVKAREELMTSR